MDYAEEFKGGVQKRLLTKTQMVKTRCVYFLFMSLSFSQARNDQVLTTNPGLKTLPYVI